MILLKEWPQAADVQAIDFFCGPDPRDPTGEAVVSRFIPFVQSLVFYRIEHANHPCRLTVVTHGAAFDVEEPRGSGLWGGRFGVWPSKSAKKPGSIFAWWT